MIQFRKPPAGWHVGAKGRRKPGTMNRLETKYAEVLQARFVSGEIAGWWFEGIKLRIGEKCFYSPDFLVMLPDGTLELHDTKAIWSTGKFGTADDAKVKMRAVSDKYPFRMVSAAWSKKTGWVVEVL